MSRKKTIDEFKKEVFNLVGDEYLVLSDTYINNKTKIKFKHNLPGCENIFEMTPHSFLLGQRCPKEKYTRRISPLKYSFENVINKINQISNNEYTIEEYKKIEEKAKFTHLKCGNVFYMTVNHFFCGNRCPKCSKKEANKWRKISINDYQKKINEISNSRFKILGNPENCMEITDIFCNKCNTSFKTSINNLIYKHFCPNCFHKKRLELLNKCEDYFKIIDDKQMLINSSWKDKKEINVKCKICESKMKFSLKNFIKKYGECRCKICQGYTQEKKIQKYLTTLGYNFEEQKIFNKCKYKNVLKFDFYINSKNLLIEYDGEFHFIPIFGEETLKEQQIRDYTKNQFCKNNKINLLRINYLEKDYIIKILKNIKNFSSDYNKNYNLDIRKTICPTETPLIAGSSLELKLPNGENV